MNTFCIASFRQGIAQLQLARLDEVALLDKTVGFLQVAVGVVEDGAGHVGICVLRRPRIERRSKEVGTGVHAFVEMLVSVVELVSPCAAQNKGKVEAFVAGERS